MKIILQKQEVELIESSEKFSKKYKYTYGVRHHTNDWDKPITIEETVCCNRWGYAGCNKKLKFKDGYIDIARKVKYVN